MSGRVESMSFSGASLVRVRIVDIQRTGIPWSIHRDLARGWPCPYCWSIMEGRAPHPRAPTWDHVIPTSKGGPDNSANIVPACLECNSYKGDRDPMTWLGYLQATAMSPRRIKPLTRFITYATMDLPDDDRVKIWQQVNDAKQTEIEAMDVQRRMLGEKLQFAAGSKRDKARHIMNAIGFQPHQWRWVEPYWVHFDVDASKVAVPFHSVDQFRTHVAAEIQRAADKMRGSAPGSAKIFMS